MKINIEEYAIECREMQQSDLVVSKEIQSFNTGGLGNRGLEQKKILENNGGSNKAT